MILSDRDIKHLIGQGVYIVNPFNIEDLQPCSIDLHLNDVLKTLHGKSISLKESSYKLKPYEFILGSTIESVNIPFNMMARVEGKSSIGRLGVMVHITAGFIDSGFHGNITLEIFNCSDKEFELVYSDSICQIAFETLTSPCENPYDGKYQGDTGTVNSRYEYG
ncbi:dCTP deaminase [Methanobrevibacter sp.]